MQNSLHHLLAKYRGTDVTPKFLKITRQEDSHEQETWRQKSLPLLKVMFYENLICGAAGLFNV